MLSKLPAARRTRVKEGPDNNYDRTMYINWEMGNPAVECKAGELFAQMLLILVASSPHTCDIAAEVIPTYFQKLGASQVLSLMAALEALALLTVKVSSGPTVPPSIIIVGNLVVKSNASRNLLGYELSKSLECRGHCQPPKSEAS